MERPQAWSSQLGWGRCIRWSLSLSVSLSLYLFIAPTAYLKYFLGLQCIYMYPVCSTGRWGFPVPYFFEFVLNGKSFQDLLASGRNAAHGSGWTCPKPKGTNAFMAIQRGTTSERVAGRNFSALFWCATILHSCGITWCCNCVSTKCSALPVWNMR